MKYIAIEVAHQGTAQFLVLCAVKPHTHQPAVCMVFFVSRIDLLFDGNPACGLCAFQYSCEEFGTSFLKLWGAHTGRCVENEVIVFKCYAANAVNVVGTLYTRFEIVCIRRRTVLLDSHPNKIANAQMLYTDSH